MRQLRKRAIAYGCLVVLTGAVVLVAARNRGARLLRRWSRPVQEIWQPFQRMVCESGSASTKTWPIR